MAHADEIIAFPIKVFSLESPGNTREPHTSIPMNDKTIVLVTERETDFRGPRWCVVGEQMLLADRLCLILNSFVSAGGKIQRKQRVTGIPGAGRNNYLKVRVKGDNENN